MPLINCPDCKALISDASEKCIHCGRPMKSSNEKIIIEIQIQMQELQNLRNYFDEVADNCADETDLVIMEKLIIRMKEFEINIDKLKNQL